LGLLEVAYSLPCPFIDLGSRPTNKTRAHIVRIYVKSCHKIVGLQTEKAHPRKIFSKSDWEGEIGLNPVAIPELCCSPGREIVG
jgi:hypothetical protein